MRKQTRNVRTWRRWVCLSAIASCCTLILAGCGSSTTGLQGSAKEQKEEDRFRYEGTGNAKQKVLIRRKEERFKGLSEPSKDPG